MYTSRRGDEHRSLKPEENNIKFHPLATDEFKESAKFYESRRTGLGKRSIDAVEKTLALIRTNPPIGKIDQEGNRRFRVKKFPFLIIYKVREGKIFVLAVAHTSKKPGYWKDRYF